jgi:hypothetical protein
VTVSRDVSRACCDDSPHLCPGCLRVMSHREWDEQRACNDCTEGWTGR